MTDAPLPDTANLPAEVASSLEPHLDADGAQFQTLDMPGILTLARLTGATPSGAMIACLEQGIWPLRFLENRKLFSAADQVRLLKSSVAVMGLGRRGGVVVLLLAHYGIGRFILCDNEVFTEASLNSQFLSTEGCLGMNKARAARAELLRIASHVDCSCHAGFHDSADLETMLHGASMVIDCLRNDREDRQILRKTAATMNVPFIHGSIEGRDGFVLVSTPGRETVKTLYGPPGYSPDTDADLFSGAPTLSPIFMGGLQTHAAIKTLLRRHGETPSKWSLDLPDLEFFAL